MKTVRKFLHASNRLQHEKFGHLPKRKSTAEINDERLLEDAETNDEEHSQVYTFIEIPSFAALTLYFPVLFII